MSDEDRAQFHEERRHGIGGSDVAAVLGVHPYRSAHDVYQEKIGEALPRPETPAMTRGRELEPYIARWYASQTSRAVARAPALYTHPDHPELRVHVDAMAVDREKGTGPVEFKSPSIRNFMEWKLAGLPVYHYVQIQHAIGILPPELARYGGAVFFSAELWDGVHFDVPPDWELIAQIQQRCLAFWHDHVLARVPPPFEDRPELEVQVPELEGSDVKLLFRRDDPEWAVAMQAMWEARQLLEDAEALQKQADDRVKELMGPAQIVEGAGARVYWKEQAGRVSLDTDRLKKARPLDRDKVLAYVARLARELDNPMLSALNVGLGDCTLDFSEYQKIARGSRPFRPYRLKGS